MGEMLDEIEHSEIKQYLRRVRMKKSDGTLKRRKSDLKHFEGWMAENGFDDVSELGPLDLEDYIFDMDEEGYAAKTISIRYGSLNQLYQKLTDKFGVLDENPMEQVTMSDFENITTQTKKATELKEDIHSISPEEKEALCENVPNPSLRNELVIRLLWQTGLRKGELADIKLSDIDRDERSIKIRAEKTHANRKVYYQPKLDILLKQWINGGYRSAYTIASESSYLFLTPKAEKFRWNRANDIVRAAAENAGIQEVMYEDAAGNPRYKITSHTLRHSYAIQALNNGMDIKTLSELMGHKNLETTKQYLDQSDEQIREKARQFGPGTEEVEHE